MKKSSSHFSGFTLIEVLVVLVIVSLIATILLQALSQVFKLQGRFGLQLAQSQEGMMYADWVRQIVQGLRPDTAQGQGKFRGGSDQLMGITTSPLSADYGAPTLVVLRIESTSREGVTRLVYQPASRASLPGRLDLGPATTLMTLPRRDGARFIYLDANGDHHVQWPPATGVWPQLPNAVLFESGWGEQRQLLAAVPRGSREALPSDLPGLGMVQ